MAVSFLLSTNRNTENAIPQLVPSPFFSASSQHTVPTKYFHYVERVWKTSSQA